MVYIAGLIILARRPVQTPRRNAPLIWFFILALYVLFARLYRTLPRLSFFLHFFWPILPYLAYSLRIDPLHFQARCCKRQLNLALVLLCLFCVVEYFFWLANACFCYVRCSFSPKIEWWGVGVVICLERGADCLHMVQLMPLHPKTPSPLASFKSRLVLTLWYRLTHVVLEKRPLNGCGSNSSSF